MTAAGDGWAGGSVLCGAASEGPWVRSHGHGLERPWRGEGRSEGAIRNNIGSVEIKKKKGCRKMIIKA